MLSGGSGFIGSNLVRFLLQTTEHRVLNLDRLSYAGDTGSLADIEDDERYAFCKVDLSQDASLGELFAQFRPQAVMHLAAETHVDRSIDGPGEFIRSNVTGTFNLLRAALDYWKTLPPGDEREAFRFLHVSTDEVYGSLQPGDPAFSETTRYDPHSPYSASKAASDHLARAWHGTYGLPVLITNCSNNYGPYQFPEKLIPVVILKCLREEPIPVYGKGENVRDWLYVADHVDALYRVLRKGRTGEVYNIGGENEQRNIDLVGAICQEMDQLNPREKGAAHADLIQFVEDRPGHDFRYAMDIGKIRRELDWAPRETFQSGLHKTVRWYLDNRSWWEPIVAKTGALQRLGRPT